MESHRRAIRWQLGLSVFFVILGAILFGIGAQLSQQIEGDFPKSSLLSLAGAFVSTLCALPIKDLLLRCEKIDALMFLKNEVETTGPDYNSKVVNDMLLTALNSLIAK